MLGRKFFNPSVLAFCLVGLPPTCFAFLEDLERRCALASGLSAIPCSSFSRVAEKRRPLLEPTALPRPGVLLTVLELVRRRFTAAAHEARFLARESREDIWRRFSFSSMRFDDL